MELFSPQDFGMNPTRKFLLTLKINFLSNSTKTLTTFSIKFSSEKDLTSLNLKGLCYEPILTDGGGGGVGAA